MAERRRVGGLDLTLTLLGALIVLGASPNLAHAQDESGLRVEVVAEGLDTPWDLAWGPDGRIWFTERMGRISRLDPESGEVEVVGELDEVAERGEAGLMGMAFHPDFETEPWVYAAHSYAGDGLQNRLVRMRWRNGRLGPPEVLLDGIPGRWNHDGSRLTVGPDGYLYMTMGDAGNADAAQDLESLSGKVLRLTPDGRPAPGNPFGNEVWSYGHRNPQGLVFHPRTGELYISDHGPRDNDEVHRVEEGGDHGWPEVRGRCDGDSRGEVRYCARNDVVEPISTWTPTVAVAGADFYIGDLLPDWDGDLLVTSLRGATLWRLELSLDGGRVLDRHALFQGDFGRLRDVLVGPDGAVYLATSNRDGRGSPAGNDDRILRIVPR